MTPVWSVLLALAGLYLILLALVTWFSLRPMRLVQWFSPAMVGLPQEDVSFTTSDGIVIRGWYTEAGKGKVVVAVHGYMMNRCEFAPYAQMFFQDGWSTLVFDTRAQGKSGGKRVGLGCDEKLDVEAAVAWVLEREPDARIVLFGSSMGGIASSLAAAERPQDIEALLLDGAYASLNDAIDGWWEFIGWRGLSKLLSPVKYAGMLIVGINPKEVMLQKMLPGFKGKPALLLYGSEDKLIKPESVKELSDGLPGHEVRVFEGSDHGQARLDHGPDYRAAVLGFLRKLDHLKEA